MVRIIRDLIVLLGVMCLFGFILMLFNGRYSDTTDMFICALVILFIAFLLTRYIEKRAYDVHQKDYGIVIISNEWMTSNKFDSEQESAVQPFENEVITFFDTGKVSETFAYTLADWNERKGVVRISQDPTFLVISGNGNAIRKKAMRQPFVVTSNSAEVLQFLESYK
ncbi:hypothetical protein [Peribacillus asahii]|uniref:hypothetical protein n=1 Tax=Peribacillus asahii TaxID=228899 RepID=UPI002079520A|nr:hypothetical protein [Peribacillus asahii]USK68812.1 hypothetical protein LIS76_14655 [Peribacillus asahii]